MRIKNSQDYRESLKKLKANVYVQGEKVEDVTENPLIIPHINSLSLTYELANVEEYQELLLAESHLTGEKISRFTHIHQSREDLVKKVKMLRLLGQKTGSCFQRCVGFDALNAVYATTYDIDKKYNTSYHQKFREYLKYIQRENLVVCGAMTDPKGDRSLRPSQQKDPDMFLHIVEKKKDGIIVRGAKMHLTGAANSHEILVMPTLSLTEEEKDYAVCFAIPLNSPKITIIFGRQATDTRRLENSRIDVGNLLYGVVGGESLVVFEDVFVPEERVFMAGEYDFSGLLVERFAIFHRQNYGGCKVGVSDVLIGAAALLSEYQGVDKAPHIRDKIVEMIHLAETLYCCSLACSYEGKPTPSGSYVANPLYANITKLNVTKFVYEIARLSHDIAGGFIATMPSEKDLKNPEIAKYIEKYYSTKEGVPFEARMKLGRLIENMTSGTPQVESMHGAGSPQTQRVVITRQAEIEYKKKIVKEILQIEEG